MTGAPVHPPRLLGELIGNDTLLRAWQGFWGIVFLAAWWYLGTPDGIARRAAIAAR